MTSYQESDSASHRDENKDSFGCLIPLIASTVFLAIAVTLISWFMLSDDEEEDLSGGGEAVASSDEARPATSATDLLEGFVPDDQGASSQALLEVVRSGNWTEFGQPEVIDLGSQLQVVRKFRRPNEKTQPDEARKQDEHVRVTIHTLKSEASTQSILENTELPARAVQFNNKVIVVEPITDGSKSMVGPLADRLRKFRELLDERETSE